jgi:hypothetical protein
MDLKSIKKLDPPLKALLLESRTREIRRIKKKVYRSKMRSSIVDGEAIEEKFDPAGSIKVLDPTDEIRVKREKKVRRHHHRRNRRQKRRGRTGGALGWLTSALSYLL